MSIFPDSPDIFKDDASLDSDYQEELYINRDGPETELANHIAPVLEGRSPGTIVLHGGPGTGKSTTTQYIFDQLGEETSDNCLTTISATIEEGDTAYQALIEILNEIHSVIDRETITQTGHSHKDVRKKMYNALDKLEGILLIAVDDVHLLKEPNKLFNDLSRARERGDVSTQLGLILIANDLSFLDQLSSETVSTLKPKEISFPSYKTSELYEILQQRSHKAFHEDSVPEEVLQRCAALGARGGGDARYSIALLKEAGEQACIRLRDSSNPNRDKNMITENDVDKAEEILEDRWFSNTVSGLSTREKGVLLQTAVLACNGETPCRTQKIHRNYNQFSDESVSQRHLRESLANLVTQGLIIRNNQNQGAKRDGNGGQYYEYELGEELIPALIALKDMDILETSETPVEELCEDAMNNDLLTSDERDLILDS